MPTLKRSSEICKNYGFTTAKAMHAVLKESGVIELVRNRWQLTREYSGCDLARLKYLRTTGWRLLWTDKGIAFINDLMSGQQRMDYKRVG